MEEHIRKYLPNGTYEDLSTPMDWDTVRQGIGGYIEVVHWNGLHLLCDEEGKIKGEPLTLFLDQQSFVGTVFVGYLEQDGTLSPVPDEQLEQLDQHIWQLA